MKSLRFPDFLFFLGILLALLLCLAPAGRAADDTRGASVREEGRSIVLANNGFTLTLDTATGRIKGLGRKRDNLELVAPVAFGYLNLAWKPAGSDEHVPLRPLAKEVHVQIIQRGPERAEVSFLYPATAQQPLEIDLRFVMFSDTPGFYIYDIARHPADAAPIDLHNLDWLQRSRADIFNYRFLHDQIQGALWPVDDLKYKTPENEIINETYRFPDGRLWAKHMWQNKDLFSPVFGYCGKDVGLWYVIPGTESFGGIRPLCEDSIVHETTQGPVMSIPMENNYYGRGPITIRGAWAKIHGPFLVYVNSGPTRDALWADAKQRAVTEAQQWPYAWLDHPLFEKNRGELTGRLQIIDGSRAAGACVLLGDAVSPWQQHQSPYLFWAYAGAGGAFRIPKVRPGLYTLYAFVPGVLGEYRQDNIEVKAGGVSDIGTVAWTPVRHGKLLWQIGTPDRGGREFKNGTTFRQWDNYLRYRPDFPQDVHFVIGQSQEAQDWNYIQPAQVKGETKPVVWTIQFNLKAVPSGEAFLTIALGSTRDATMDVLLNGARIGRLHYPYADARDSIDSIGIRAGMYGRYTEDVLRFPASQLKTGQNVITLRPAGRLNWLSYVLYDCVRLEVADR